MAGLDPVTHSPRASAVNGELALSVVSGQDLFGLADARRGWVAGPSPTMERFVFVRVHLTGKIF
jgi:hypothetical protein